MTHEHTDSQHENKISIDCPILSVSTETVMPNVVMLNAMMVSAAAPELNLVYLGLICFGFYCLMLSVTTEPGMPNVIMPNAMMASAAQLS
jgi:hypothetical protein